MQRAIADLSGLHSTDADQRPWLRHAAWPAAFHPLSDPAIPDQTSLLAIDDYRFVPPRPPAELGRVVAGDPETVLARLRALADAGATWCVLATVGGPGAEMRALLAAAQSGPERIG